MATVGVVLALGLSGCAGEGITRPTTSRSSGIALPSATATLPELSRSPSVDATATQPPDPTATPTTEAPAPTTEAPAPTTEAPRPTPTVKPSTATVTATPTTPPTETVTATPTPTSEPTPTETPTPEPTPTASPSPTSTDLAGAEPTATDAGVSPWVWVLLVGLVAAGLAAYLVPRSRRRKEWAADLAADEAEVAWFARELLPRLQQAATPDALEGGWEVGVARVTAAEDRLTGLESTAPDDSGRARARTLRDAVRSARLGVEDLVFAGRPGLHPSELSLLAGGLETALAESATGGPTASGPPASGPPASGPPAPTD